ncbi:MAG: hypothetical protein ACYDDF_11585 [Thermoplasmatota archaeon]
MSSSRDAIGAAMLHSSMARVPARSDPAEVPSPRAALGLTFDEAVTASLVFDFSALYGETRWSPAAFRQHILSGAMAVWKGGTSVEENPRGGLVVTGRLCPLADRVARDPQTCVRCRALHRALVGVLFDGGAEVQFLTTSPAQGGCAFRIDTAPEP